MATKKSEGKTEKTIGLDVKAPEKTCDDKNCPFHGSLKVRGRTFTGTVVSDKMQKSISVQWPVRKFNKKYERFELRRTKVKAHNPPCINAKTGETVKIIETKPISKTKNFVVVEIIKK